MLWILVCIAVAAALLAYFLLVGNGRALAPRRSAVGDGRTHERLEVVFPVRLQALDHQYLADTQNLSDGGMLLRLDAPLDVAQPVQLSFALPDDGAVEIPAVVSHKRPGLIGLRFDPTHPARRAIERWVTQATRAERERADKV